MKTLFRSIRRKLLDEGKLVRYLTYAVGEVVLIIVGILFALKINDWNEEKKAQVEFDAYVVQLREDVRHVISVTENRSRTAETRRQQALTVLRVVKGSEIEQDEFEDALNILDQYSFSEIHYGHLGQLLNGNLEAISLNKNLSRQVT